MTLPSLAWERVTHGGEPDRWMAVLHGTYGHGRNWSSVLRRVVRERPEWGGAMMDLRGHGDSKGLEGPHTVEAAARDVLRTARADGLELGAVLGHSLGGKIALECLRLAASNADAPSQVWVIDSTPASGEREGGAWNMLQALRRHPGPFRSRDEAIHGLEQEGFGTGVARWMAIALEHELDGSWRWGLELDVIEALLRDFFDRELWEVVEAPPEGVEVHLVRATRSSVLDGEALERARQAADGSQQVHLHEVDGGHWLNADNPDAVVELLVDGLP